MRLLRRPGFRFVVEAAAILLAALVAGLRDVGWPGIVAAVAVVWVIAALAEYSLSSPKPRARPAIVPAAPEPAAETVRVLPRDAEPEPVHVVESAARPEAVSDTEPESDSSEPDPEAEPEPLAEPRRWNIWEVDRLVRERGEATEEQEFLLLYLRDYADPDGLLPIDFDGLVRDSFAEALVAVAG